MIRKRVCKKFGETSLSVKPYGGHVIKFEPMKRITVRIEFKPEIKFFQGISIEGIVSIISGLGLETRWGKPNVLYVTAFEKRWKELNMAYFNGLGVDTIVKRLFVYYMVGCIKGMDPVCSQFESIGDLSHVCKSVNVASTKSLKGSKSESIYLYFTHPSETSIKRHMEGIQYQQFSIGETLLPVSLVAFESDLDGDIVSTASHDVNAVQKWIEFERARDIFNTSLAEMGLGHNACESSITVTIISSSVEAIVNTAKKMIDSENDELFLLGIKIKEVVNDSSDRSADREEG